MQLLHQVLDLLGRKLGPVAAPASLYQNGHSLLPVGAAPLQQTGRATATDVANLRDRVALPVEPHGLIAGLGGSIPTVKIGRV
jgi:hypothetical protein